MTTLELNLNEDGTKGIDFLYDEDLYGTEMNIFVNMDNDNENFTVEHMRKLHDFIGKYLEKYETVITALDSPQDGLVYEDVPHRFVKNTHGCTHIYKTS